MEAGRRCLTQEGNQAVLTDLQLMWEQKYQSSDLQVKNQRSLEIDHARLLLQTGLGSFGDNQHLHVFLICHSAPPSSCSTCPSGLVPTPPEQEADSEGRSRSGLSMAAAPVCTRPAADLYRRDTHTCPGRIKNINEITLAIINLCLICNLGFSAIFFFSAKRNLMTFVADYLQISRVSARVWHHPSPRTVMAAWTQLRHGQERNPGFSLGLHHQKPSISAGRPEDEEHLKYFMFHRPG